MTTRAATAAVEAAKSNNKRARMQAVCRMAVGLDPAASYHPGSLFDAWDLIDRWVNEGGRGEELNR